MLSDRTSPTPTIAPTVAGTFAFNLIVSDDLGASGTDSVIVKVFQRGDVNMDGVIDQNDLDLIRAALNTPATDPADPRDLNNDGIIDAVDARILVGLCTKSRCAL